MHKKYKSCSLLACGLLTAVAVCAEKTVSEFAGLDFGVGISVTIDTGDNDRVKSASIIDGVVRVDEQENVVARVMLESHYFWTPKHLFGKKDWLELNKEGEDPRFGWGPFVALQPGTDEIIEAIGLGVMCGWKRQDSNGSWNLGIGAIVDPSVQILGDDYTANQPPPGSETQVRYKTTSQTGLMLLASFTF